MPTISSGNNVTGTFGFTDSVTVTSRGTVRFESPTGTVIADVTGTRTLGPYSNQTYRVTALAGDAQYEVSDGTGPVVAVVVDKKTGALSGVDGSPVSGYGNAGIATTNLAALKPFAETLLGAALSEVYITGTGDSLMQLGGDTVNLSSETLAETDGGLAQLRNELNLLLGTPDGGQWIAVEAAPSDTRVANSTSPATTPINQFGPYNAYRNSGGSITQRRAMALQSSGMSITFYVVGRYLDVELWENAGTYTGTATWTVDGGGGGTINSNGGGAAADTYRTVRLDLGTDAAHTVVIAWASGNNMFTGATVTRGRGVVTRRIAYGGSKAATWAALTAKQIRTSFNTLPAHLHIIRDSYNPWNNQVADGLTIAAYKASLQTQIDAALLNASNKAVLLMADPPSSTADTNPILYRALANAQRDLALVNPKVAFYDVDVVLNGSYAAGNAAGLYADFVHRSKAGFSGEFRPLARLLYSMARVGA